MAPSNIIKARVLNSFYYFDLQDDGSWSKNPSPKEAGTIIPMKYLDFMEVRGNKAEIANEPAAEMPKKPDAPVVLPEKKSKSDK